MTSILDFHGQGNWGPLCITVYNVVPRLFAHEIARLRFLSNSLQNFAFVLARNAPMTSQGIHVGQGIPREYIYINIRIYRLETLNVQNFVVASGSSAPPLPPPSQSWKRSYIHASLFNELNPKSCVLSSLYSISLFFMHVWIIAANFRLSLHPILAVYVFLVVKWTSASEILVTER